jgi:hypothetical protein
MSPHRTTLDPSQIDAIEGRLAGTLRPVSPPVEFVQKLRGHIQLPEGNVIVFRLRSWTDLLFILGGVLSGAMVILTLARAMYYLFGRRNA